MLSCIFALGKSANLQNPQYYCIEFQEDKEINGFTDEFHGPTWTYMDLLIRGLWNDLTDCSCILSGVRSAVRVQWHGPVLPNSQESITVNASKRALGRRHV
ncbi:uncharacterized protein LOC107270883 [Cephus cinctus]|uniref:Uncharacterized protein LOC107270883 n=1 Tax=Cephus cinctus TaxID=211228 RepID=A0AAJ7FPE5_CEPCN|nr:uncharacterized protein LOC107270883 [Cephus cinctus]